MGAAEKNRAGMYDLISATTEKLSEKYIAIRRRLYQWPELSGKEINTGKFIAESLEEMSINVRRNVGGNGVVGILEGGLPGRTVGWRADIDALPIQDTVNRDYRSAIENVKHACGHDVHTAVALGTAEVMSLLGKQGSYPGRVKFFFQPSEEQGDGARAMIKDGALDDPTPEYMFGLHVSPHNVGTVAVITGFMMSGVQYFTLRFRRDGSCSDLVGTIRGNLMNLARKVNTYQWLNMNNCQHREQHPEKIDRNKFIRLQLFRQECSLKENELLIRGIIAASTRDNFVFLKNELARTVEEVSERKGLDCEIRMDKFVPPIKNNQAVAEKSVVALKGVPGVKTNCCNENIFFPFSADDYGCFQEKIPGVYFGLGYLNKEKGIIAQRHTPNFDVDEQCIAVGIKAASNILISFLRKI